MEIAKLVLEFWKASVWPVVFVITVLLFRSQIRDALRRARAIDAMGVNVELAEQVEEAEEALEEAREEAASKPEPDVTPTGFAEDTVAKATEALEAVLNIRRTNLPSAPLPESVMRLHLALEATARAFGHSRFDSDATSDLIERTRLQGWSTIEETYRMIVRPASSRIGVEVRDDSLDRRAFGYLAYDTFETLVALLYGVAWRSRGQDPSAT